MKIIIFCFVLLSGCAGERPIDLGLKKQRLAVCPESPNCVSSIDKRKSHQISPINTSIERLKKLLLTMKQVKIIVEEKDYIYAEFSSDIMNFVDDVEFLFDSQDKIVNVRSASRLGYSDFGVNRNRIEFIRAALLQ